MTPEKSSRGLRVWWLVYRVINCEYQRSNLLLTAPPDDACHTSHVCGGGSDDSSASHSNRKMKLPLYQAVRRHLLLSLMTYDRFCLTYI